MMQIALTIDDLPCARHVPLSKDEQLQVTAQVLTILDRFKVCSLGFAVGSWTASPHDQALMYSYVNRGHLVGNHGHRHNSIDRMTAKQFERDLLRAHRALLKWSKAPFLFRYPYLHMGNSLKRSREASATLFKHGYTAVPVTIVLEDWWYDAQYSVALLEGDSSAAVLRTKYLCYFARTIQHFRIVAENELSRTPKHILLLHMNRLNADTLDQALTHCLETGCRFVNPLDALEDPLYRMQSVAFGEQGGSWLYHVKGGSNDCAQHN